MRSGLSENRDYARRHLLRRSKIPVLQKRNSEFFSLEYCGPLAIIRGAMAGNKTDRYGHIESPAAKIHLASCLNHHLGVQ